MTEQRLHAIQEGLVNKIDSQQTTPTIINNLAQQHNIIIETAANVAEERRSQLNKSLHYLAEHNGPTFE
ncbi:hypothetical protein [Absidia glauca]|uniref:Uncharacterized protein n=1 Tax=Absidia glauca TaxID=4829 RepID=A0A163MGJ5_ABSGL|nr:hypothetical protein [Absidia glauca]